MPPAPAPGEIAPPESAGRINNEVIWFQRLSSHCFQPEIPWTWVRWDEISAGQLIYKTDDVLAWKYLEAFHPLCWRELGIRDEAVSLILDYCMKNIFYMLNGSSLNWISSRRPCSRGSNGMKTLWRAPNILLPSSLKSHIVRQKREATSWMKIDI